MSISTLSGIPDVAHDLVNIYQVYPVVRTTNKENPDIYCSCSKLTITTTISVVAAGKHSNVNMDKK